MADHQWFVYRDVEDFPRKQFERIAAPLPGTLVIRDSVLPGMFGYPPLHIKWHTVEVDTTTVHLLTYTEEPVSIVAAAALAEQAMKGDTHA